MLIPLECVSKAFLRCGKNIEFDTIKMYILISAVSLTDVHLAQNVVYGSFSSDLPKELLKKKKKKRRIPKIPLTPNLLLCQNFYRVGPRAICFQKADKVDFTLPSNGATEVQNFRGSDELYLIVTSMVIIRIYFSDLFNID